MRSIAAIVAFVALVGAYDPEAIIRAVNDNPESTWTAGPNEAFITSKGGLRGVQALLGSSVGPNKKLPVRKHVVDQASLPASFDPKDKWGACIGPVLNQGSCGSCWAFGAVESISDRMCIASGKQNFVQLAPLDIVTCDTGFFGSNGCFGGEPSQAWSWVQSNGLVTEQCRPYLQAEGGPIGTCPPAEQPCTNFEQTPQCVRQCNSNSTLNYQKDKHYPVTSVYGLNQDEDQWKTELMTNGPFESAFTVYADFVHYKSGVYQHTTGQALGGHAISIHGWGEENGTPYWLVKNSWTTGWGDDGYFKIIRGTNSCGIESGGVAGDVQAA
jgi:cathepsin B